VKGRRGEGEKRCAKKKRRREKKEKKEEKRSKEGEKQLRHLATSY